MAEYRFGREEAITCIVNVPLHDSDGKQFCVAYKTTTFSVLAPVYFRDDGYVLSSAPGFYRAMPTGTELEGMQQLGVLPKPLPAYHIPIGDYVMGYVLWPALAVGAVVTAIGSAFKRRRHQSLATQQPPSFGAPELRTKTDHWLAQEAAKLLEGNEVVQQQAYGLSGDVGGVAVAMLHAMYVILTDRRLLVIKSRIGAFGPLHENNGLRTFARTDVASVDHDERHLRFHFANGDKLDFYAEWSERKLSNQHRFLRDVPRLLGVQTTATHALA